MKGSNKAYATPPTFVGRVSPSIDGGAIDETWLGPVVISRLGTRVSLALPSVVGFPRAAKRGWADVFFKKVFFVIEINRPHSDVAVHG